MRKLRTNGADGFGAQPLKHSAHSAQPSECASAPLRSKNPLIHNFTTHLVPTFGHISSYRPGDLFENRLALSLARMHRPPRAGVSGTQLDGADSIVLAGAYEDDAFDEHEIIYSGSGGRDPRTGRQVTNQEMTGRNLVLRRSQETGRPVRVLHKVRHEGREQLRYEGLFRVTKHYFAQGKAGFRVLKFHLVPFTT